MSLISIKNICFKYKDEKIIDNISFDINPGNYLCIIGENGSGKTTLLSCLLGLLNIDDGEIIYDKDFDKQIAFLPQQNNIQKDFPATVEEVVLSGCLNNLKNRLFYSSKEKELAKSKMELLDIWDLRKKSFKNLSGGQKQRVLLSRALCASDKLLFLDEPISGLDEKTSKQFYEMLNKLNKDGTTIVMISHDGKEIMKYASHILYLGDKNFFGCKDDYLKWRKNI